MTWFNTNTFEYVIDRPVRVRLPDGSTRTQEAVTDEILKEAGWKFMIDPPAPGATNDTN